MERDGRTEVEKRERKSHATDERAASQCEQTTAEFPVAAGV